MAFPIISAILGVYMIFTGFRLIATGKLSAGEERGLANFTEKAKKTYKLTYSVISILVGLLMIAQAVIRILSEQKIMPEIPALRITIWCTMVALLVVLFIVWFKCKKDSKNDKE